MGPWQVFGVDAHSTLHVQTCLPSLTSLFVVRRTAADTPHRPLSRDDAKTSRYWQENILPPRVATVSILGGGGRQEAGCERTDIAHWKRKKTKQNEKKKNERKGKPETPFVEGEIGHHKGINDGSFQHNCLIMPGRWGSALTRTHCATSPDSPQQKANQCDSLFSSEWEGE